MRLHLRLQPLNQIHITTLLRIPLLFLLQLPFNLNLQFLIAISLFRLQILQLLSHRDHVSRTHFPLLEFIELSDAVI